jgi:hypothetical protein
MQVSIPLENSKSFHSPMSNDEGGDGGLNFVASLSANKTTGGCEMGPVQQAVQASNDHFSMFDEMTEMLSANKVTAPYSGAVAMCGGPAVLAAMASSSLTSSSQHESKPQPINYYPNYGTSGAIKYYDANFNWVGGVKGGALKVASASSAAALGGAVRDEVVLAEAAHQRGMAERAVRYCYPSFLRTYKRMEWIGGKVSWLLGLESSRFQYAVDEYNRQKDMKAHREAMAAKHKQEVYLAKGMEGMDDPNDDVSDLPYLPTPFTSY